MRSTKRKTIFVKNQFRPATASYPSATIGTRGNNMDWTDMDKEDSRVPWYLRVVPLLRDQIVTATTNLQQQTIGECLPLLNGLHSPARSPFDFDENGFPALDKEDHIEFAHGALEPYPAPFVALDASRPWLIYWSLVSLYLLGEDVQSYRTRVVKTFEPLQNRSGGFGGGQGHLSHLAGTYATLLSLAIVGGQEAYEMVDRTAMWEWLGRLKQDNGGFRVCENGEEDVRGAYCALVAISLLDLPAELPPGSPARRSGLQRFDDGLGEYLSRCQTYEGGIADKPGSEAHGAYTFCAIACLCLLGSPDQMLAKYLDLESIISWLSARQYAPEGGFAGRTNKVVDGCYSHWIGGCWPLVEAAVHGALISTNTTTQHIPYRLFSSEGLARYILGCCQTPGGGLRDKPSKRPDAYHTCYTLVGLSISEHHHFYEHSSLSTPFATLLTWGIVKQGPSSESNENVNLHGNTEVPALHPVLVIPHRAVTSMRFWSQKHELNWKQ